MRKVNMDNVTYGYKGVNKEIDYKKWIDLSGLPRWEDSIYINKINWSDSVGANVCFRYKDDKGIVKIIAYNKRKREITIRYNEIDFNIKTSVFSRCGMGKVVGLRTSEFRIEIGEVFKDDKRDLIIIDRSRLNRNSGGRNKYYKFICNKCGFDCGEHYKNKDLMQEHWIEEHHLLNNRGCPCCCESPQITVSHINSIVAKEETRWMIPYFQGGYDEAKMFTKGSMSKVYFKCPDCSRIKENRIPINNVSRSRSIGCICGDGFSYPEKFIYSMFEQLKEKFITQLNKSESEWCKNYYYDFYIPSLNCIIETHGEQHYIETGRKKDRSLKEEQENDRMKRVLALENGVKHYIELDCRKSDIKWIKNSILNSKLNSLFDLSIVDWNECEEFALGSLVKDVCDKWNNKKDWETALTISSNLKISRGTVIDYLKRGNELGWCNYDTKEEMKKSAIKNGKSLHKKVEVFKDNISIGIFESCSELERKSEKLFGIKLLGSKISAVALGKRPHHKGYTFKYIEENQNIAC